MIKKITVDVEIEVNKKCCNNACKFLELSPSYCNLFVRVLMYNTKTRLYARCDKCLLVEGKK